MKGMLKILVMKALEGNPDISGAELSRIIEKRTERKPSPGSLYPLLKNLKEKNLVKEDESGKENIYRLTEKSENTLEDFERKREEIIDRIITHMKEYNFLFSEKQINQFINHLEKLKKWHERIPSYFVKMGEIKNILFKIEDISGDEEKKIASILETARQEIEDVVENE